MRPRWRVTRPHSGSGCRCCQQQRQPGRAGDWNDQRVRTGCRESSSCAARCRVLLESTDLHMSFDGRQVLSGASLEVQACETVAVLGPSGSGKTTLLSVCGLLLRADSGSVRIDGQEVNRMSQLRPGAIGWVLQQSNSFPRRTVLDNVALGSLAAGFSHAESLGLSERALTDVGLSGRLHSEARELSGGNSNGCVWPARSLRAQS